MQVSLTSVSLRHLILLHELVYAHLLHKLHNETHFKIKGFSPNYKILSDLALQLTFCLLGLFSPLGSGCCGMNPEQVALEVTGIWDWLG